MVRIHVDGAKDSPFDADSLTYTAAVAMLVDPNAIFEVYDLVARRRLAIPARRVTHIEEPIR